MGEAFVPGVGRLNVPTDVVRQDQRSHRARGWGHVVARESQWIHGDNRHRQRELGAPKSHPYLPICLPAAESTYQVAPNAFRSWPWVCRGPVSLTNP